MLLRNWKVSNRPAIILLRALETGHPLAGHGLSLLEIHMASVYLRYLQCNMKGHNICDWTKVGERALCGKSCCGTYSGSPV